MVENLNSGHHDNAWIKIDSADDPNFFIRFLDATREKAYNFAKQNPQIAFAHLNLSNRKNILDCGCGTGDMLTLMAEHIGTGRAVGVELSQTMVDEAIKRNSNGPTNVSFEKMDVQKLSFSDGEFDLVMATQLLVHLPDPFKAFHEMYRVTASGGKIVLADIDWDSLTLGSTDIELGRRFTELFSDNIRNGVIVREYARWFNSVGIKNIKIIPQPMLIDQFDFLNEWILKPSLKQYILNGAMTTAEVESLMEDLSARAKDGCTFSGATFYTVVAEKN